MKIFLKSISSALILMVVEASVAGRRRPALPPTSAHSPDAFCPPAGRSLPDQRQTAFDGREELPITQSPPAAGIREKKQRASKYGTQVTVNGEDRVSRRRRRRRQRCANDLCPIVLELN